MAALIAVLSLMIGGAVYFFISTRPRTASELYDTIQSPETEGPQQMQAMEEFLRRFKDHPDRNDVYALWMEARLDRTLNRLRARDRLGTNPLDALEQGFLDAMDLRQQDLDDAVQGLTAWIELHGSGTSDPAQRELMELAKQELAALRQHSPRTLDERAEELMELVARQQGSSEELQRFLQNLEQVHGEHEWAQPAIAEAASQVERVTWQAVGRAAVTARLEILRTDLGLGWKC